MNHSRHSRVKDEHVRSLLGGEQLQRLLARLRKRMSRGEKLTGKIQLHNATSNERAAIDRLMGRLPTRGHSLTIDLDQLAAILTHAQACDSLEEAIIAVVGPIPNQRAQSLSRQEHWKQLWLTSIEQAQGNQAALGWIADLKTSGLLKRAAGGDSRVAQPLLGQALPIVLQMPLPAIRLAELAATTTGNSHALDRGQPLAALVIRLSRQFDESSRWKTSAQRRDAWETLGVLCDELSAPVLVLNLRADSQSLTGRALNLHADAGEPYRMSVRQLRRHPPSFDLKSCGPEVFVCENPTVVDVAANRLGPRCCPLVCLDGQPKSSAHLLLSLLTQAGIRIRYHGDFDWDGIRIANTVMRRHGATAWRFSTPDYVAASEKKHALKGTPIAAEWDTNLAGLMVRVGKCLHEEHVLETLLRDLKQRP